MGFEVVDHLAEAADNAGQRIVRNRDLHACFPFDKIAESPEKRATAAEHDAAAKDITGKLGRRRFDRFVDGIRNGPQ